MAIGTALALGLGAAAVGIGGSVLGTSATKKAAGKAADTAAATADKNNALARELYERNTGNFQPYLASGQRANSAFDELVFGPQPAAVPSAFGPVGATGFGTPQPSAFGANNQVFDGGEAPGFLNGARMGQPAYSNMQYGPPVYAMDQPAGGVTAPVPPQASARSAFDNYLNSTGYQFRFNEGIKGLNIGFGARGLLESGARDKAAIRYGQGIASDEFAKYMQLLDNQQRLGFGGASALAGVGQNMVSNITANNNSASSAAANAALASGAANANMWSGIGNSLGSVFGQLGSSYGVKKAF